MSAPHALGHATPRDRSLARLQLAALLVAYPTHSDQLLAGLDDAERVLVENTAHTKPLLDALMSKPEISRAGELLAVEERPDEHVATVLLPDGATYSFTMRDGAASPLVRLRGVQ